MTAKPEHTQSAYYVDADHPDVIAWANDVVGDASTDTERAVRLFYSVRDDWRYDPYSSASDADDYKASAILKTDRSWCVPKAVLLTAGARAVGVPSRVGFADVKNHLTSEKLKARMTSDVFAFHGYTTFLLPGSDGELAWVKATPAFNIEMCTRFGVKPLEFDGLSDTLYHEFDVEGRRHMEYVKERGEFDDLPWDELCRVFTEIYGHGPGGLTEDNTHDEAFHE